MNSKLKNIKWGKNETYINRLFKCIIGYFRTNYVFTKKIG